jgi:hypothetical protein
LIATGSPFVPLSQDTVNPVFFLGAKKALPIYGISLEYAVVQSLATAFAVKIS